MKFYTEQHPHYCGIDLHARTMYMCILNQAGAIVLHRNMKAEPDSFLKAITPFRHPPIDGQMRQERVHLCLSHLLRVPFPMKDNKAPYPRGVGVLRTMTIVMQAHRL